MCQEDYYDCYKDDNFQCLGYTFEPKTQTKPNGFLSDLMYPSFNNPRSVDLCTAGGVTHREDTSFFIKRY